MNTKICIGIPTAGTVKTKTLFSIIRMFKQSSFEYIIVTPESCYVHWSREYIVQRAIERKCSHVLFIDSDMFFEGNAAEQLLKRDKDIIGVQYNLRQLPAISTLKVTDESGNKIQEEYPDGLLKCIAVATGFLLIKTSVFEKLSEPWFFFESNDKGEVVYGEDMWFCQKARRAGFDIWCDTTIKVGHIGDYIY